MLFKLKASSIISFEAFLGHALFALCYEIHFYLEASRGITIKNKKTKTNKAIGKCRQKLCYKWLLEAVEGPPDLSMTKAFRVMSPT